MSSRKSLPVEILSHPALVALVEDGSRSGTVTPEQVRAASEDAAVEPRQLKALLAHLSALDIDVAIPVTTSRRAAAAARSTSTKSTAKKAPAKKTAAKKAPAKKAETATAKKAAAKKAPATSTAKKAETTAKKAAAKASTTKSTAKSTAKKATPTAKKTAAKSTTAKTTATKAAPAEKKPAAKKATTKKSAATPAAAKAAETETVEVPAAPVIGPDGKKVLPDIPDEQFEKDVAADPTIKEDEKKASFVVSNSDDTDEPEQQVTVAGATADPVKDYLKQIGKVPLLNAEMEVELAKRIDVVDPPGDHPRDGRPGAHHPHPGAHGRGHQQAQPLGEDGDSEFGDLIEDSEAVVPSDSVSFTLLQEQLHSVLDTLSEREAGVVSMRFGLNDGQPKTLDEIGKVYGVTRERIRQIESKTMAKLRHPSRSQVLRDYLD